MFLYFCPHNTRLLNKANPCSVPRSVYTISMRSGHSGGAGNWTVGWGKMVRGRNVDEGFLMWMIIACGRRLLLHSPVRYEWSNSRRSSAISTLLTFWVAVGPQSQSAYKARVVWGFWASKPYLKRVAILQRIQHTYLHSKDPDAIRLFTENIFAIVTINVANVHFVSHNWRDIEINEIIGWKTPQTEPYSAAAAVKLFDTACDHKA